MRDGARRVRGRLATLVLALGALVYSAVHGPGDAVGQSVRNTALRGAQMELETLGGLLRGSGDDGTSRKGRLRVYPQFGDPLIDLLAEVGQIRLGIVPPLAMRYAVFEERRQVFVAALPVLMPKSPTA